MEAHAPSHSQFCGEPEAGRSPEELMGKPTDKDTISWTDWNGNEVKVKLVADARNVAGLAGYPWIIMAANPQLSNMAIQRYLADCGIDGAERTLSWLQRRRWMFRTVKPGNAKGPTPDLDRNQARAIKIMREYPSRS